MIQREIKSFGHAFRGLKFLFQSQKHFRFHVLATILVISLGLWFTVSALEWTVLLLCCAGVLMTEALNSALEVALDHLHPEIHPAIGKAKDM
ncbi:MAG: diacylglycerol kinase family protein, partial [Bacteroidia bacterium]